MIRCKHCNKKFFLGFGFDKHLLKEHDIDITPNDKKHIRKMRLRFCLLPFTLLLKGLKWLVIAICFPFWWIFDTLMYEV